MPITTYCQSKWKLQYPANDANVFAYWGDAKTSEKDCFDYLDINKPAQACCLDQEFTNNNGEKETYGVYDISNIKILDKDGNCLNC